MPSPELNKWNTNFIDGLQMNGLNIIKNISLLEFGQHRVDGPTVPIKIEAYYKKKKKIFPDIPNKNFCINFLFYFISFS